MALMEGGAGREYNGGVTTRMRWAWLVAMTAGLVGVWLGRPTALTAVTVEQPRLAVAAPVPAVADSLIQTFAVGHNGLSAVEVRAVYYGAPQTAGGELTLRLWGPGEALVAEVTRRPIEHNDWLRLDFQPVTDSAGRAYRLEVVGVEARQTTLWAYPLDGYAAGELRQGPALVPGDLQFKAYYTYLWPDLARDSLEAVGGMVRLAVPLWLVLFAPGLALLAVMRPAALARAQWTRWGTALALSLSSLPLAWLWVTTLGLAWSRLALGAGYAVLGALVAGRWVLAVTRAVLRRRVRVRAVAYPGIQPVPVRFATAAAQPAPGWHDTSLALILGVSVLLRLLAVRDLAMPAWVDSSHHVYVAGLLAEAGRVPADYGALPGPSTFTYHFGVHTVLVALDWFSALDLPQTMLVAGQVLNGLMPLAIYAGAALLTGRRRAALLAALYVGVVSFFPAYFVTWGRYSQLTGLLVLAPAMGLIWMLLASKEAQAPADPWRLAACAGVLAAGVLLAHYRVFFFYAAFVAVAALLHSRAGWPVTRRLALAGLLGGVLSLPWLARLVGVAVLPLLQEPARLGTIASYNEFPAGYFSAVLERGAAALAVATCAWGLLRREKVIWALTLWVGAIFALLNLGATTWLVNNNAWAISLFVPIAIVLGWGLDRWLTRARHWLAAAPILGGTQPPWQRAARLAAGLVMVAFAAGLTVHAGAVGIRMQLGIVNPVTVLARAEDVQALEWVKTNTPADAVFLINGWNWLGAGWAGSDGGAWLMPYAQRRTTLPPSTYGFGEMALQTRVRDLAEAVFAIEDAEAPETLRLLAAEGVTHIFIGARGGNLKPEMFVDRPHYRLAFTNGAAWIFEVTGNASE